LADYSACVSVVPVDPGNPNEPVITLLGPRVVSQPLGVPYLDAGATAADPHDGNISSRLVVTGLSTLDVNTLGDYLIRYNVVDSAQLSAVEVARMVRVHAGAFTEQTARDFGSTGAHLAYYEHLPVNYSADPTQKFPLIVGRHGWGGARFTADGTAVKTPLSGLLEGDLPKLIQDGRWDDSRPFIVLSPQQCIDPLVPVATARQMKVFVDYAINTYKVDTSRIYMAGYSQGSGNTWDYVMNYPQQLAAVVPMSGGYGSQVGCLLKPTPAWAFGAADDTVVPYQNQVDTVNSINSCNPVERAKVTIFPSGGHGIIEEYMTMDLTGLGQGLPAYDIYNQNIYDWLLAHTRQPPAVAFSATPSAIAFGRPATLSWSPAGATSCRASGDWTGPRPASGTESVQPPAPGLYSYVLTCDGPAGTVAQSAVLTVREPPSAPAPYR
jgi:predicted esterase